MIPILFSYDTVDFSSHGIGDLMDTISCVTELNEDGEYELELEYPADGRYIHDLAIDNLIYVKADDHGPYQAFRIYSIEKAINSLVTVHGQHISYDLSCYPVRAYEAKTCHTAITYLIPYAISQETIPFSITTDVTEEAQNEDRKFKLEEPKSIRAALLDGDDSIKGTFGGDLIFNNFNVSLKKIGGADRGVLVEYGIDLIDMNQEENISEMITGVYPYWKGRDLTYDENGNLVSHQDKDGETIDKIIYGTVQYAAGTFRRHRVIPLNVTEYCVNLFDAEGNDREPTVAEINQIARDWIEANEIGEPEISLTISYANLKKDVRMHDAITVRFVKLGIDVKAKVVSYKYDTLKERCIQVTVGKAKPSILFDLEDASRLKRGLIPPKRIQNRSITSDKIETRAITPDVIDYNAIQPQHIEPQAVETLQLSEGIQEQLGYAELFNAATLEDPDPAMIPEQFSAQELRVLDEDGNLLSEMSADGIAAQNFNVLNADGSSAISMSGSGMHISNLLDVGETIRAKHIYASVIMESPLYSLPTAEGAAEQSVNKHTHELSADDNGKVTIGAPDFTGAEHFFNIADTKFFKDQVSAITIKSIEYDKNEDGSLNYTRIYAVLTNKTVGGDFDNTPAINSVKFRDWDFETLDGGSTDYSHIWVRLTNGNMTGNIDINMALKSVKFSNWNFETDENGSIDYGHIWVQLTNGNKTGNININTALKSVKFKDWDFETLDGGSTDYSHIWVRLTNGNKTGNIDINTALKSVKFRDWNFEATDSGSIDYSHIWVRLTNGNMTGNININAALKSVKFSNWNFETDENGSIDYKHIWVRLTNGNTTGNIDVSASYQKGYSDGGGGTASIKSSPAPWYETDEGGTTNYNKLWMRLNPGNVLASVNTSGAYNAGYDSGLGSAKIDTNYKTVTINNSHLVENGHHYIVATVKGRATGTYKSGSTFYSAAGTVLNQYKFLADTVYNANTGSDASVVSSWYATSSEDGSTDYTTKYLRLNPGYVLASVDTSEAYYAGRNNVSHSASFYLHYTGVWYQTNYGNYYQHQIRAVSTVNGSDSVESTTRLIYIVGTTFDGYYS